MTLEYGTNKRIFDDYGKERGKVKILKKAEDQVAFLDFKCPYCGVFEKRKEDWTEPFKTKDSGDCYIFHIKCNKCNLVTVVTTAIGRNEGSPRADFRDRIALAMIEQNYVEESFQKSLDEADKKKGNKIFNMIRKFLKK